MVFHQVQGLVVVEVEQIVLEGEEDACHKDYHSSLVAVQKDGLQEPWKK